jgi:hypothetical protein
VEFVLPLIRRRAAFVYPVPPAPRTAVLLPCFRSEKWFRSAKSRSRTVRIFAGGWDADAAAYHPAAIAGTWPQIESLLAHNLTSLTHALIVLARPEDSLLTTEQRQRLWRAFRVPIFEQIIGENGALLAAECEAHAGLHIESPSLKIAGSSIERALCGCGRNTPRIKPAGQAEDIRTAAASAR